nr:uncharacterized protein YMR317W-like isoform X3 [Procambarus clarkii]XP_045620797.1 uncharacterized protein YMR317W-like isoform X3 [Procambarus clarkii]XP_045620805.1 uncharacterized protein YMR317W-like isoform X3 [Procambarus clarkii]
MKAALGAAAAVTGAGALVYILLNSRKRQRDPGKRDDLSISSEENVATCSEIKSRLAMEGSNGDSKECEDIHDTNSQYENFNGHLPRSGRNSDINLDHVAGSTNENNVSEIKNTSIPLETRECSTSLNNFDSVITSDLVDKSKRLDNMTSENNLQQANTVNDQIESEKDGIRKVLTTSGKSSDGIMPDSGLTSSCIAAGLNDTESNVLCPNIKDGIINKCTLKEQSANQEWVEVHKMAGLESHVMTEESCSSPLRPKFLGEAISLPAYPASEDISSVVLCAAEEENARESNFPQIISENSLEFTSTGVKDADLPQDHTTPSISDQENGFVVQKVNLITHREEHPVILAHFDKEDSPISSNLTKKEMSTLSSDVIVKDQSTLAYSLDHEKLISLKQGDPCSELLGPSVEEASLSSSLSREEQTTLSCSLNQEDDFGISSSTALGEQAALSSSLVQEEESAPSSSLVQEEESTPSSSLVQEEESAPSSSLVQEEESAPSSSLVQEEESTPSSSLVQEEESAPSSSLVQEEESAPSSSLVQEEKSAPSSSLVQEEESAPSSSLVQEEESAPSSSLVQEEESAPSSSLVQEEESAPSSSLVQEEESAPSSSLVQEEESAPSSSLVQEEESAPSSSLVQEEESAPSSSLVQEEESAPSSSLAQEEESAPSSSLAQEEESAPSSSLAQEEESAPSSSLAQEEESAPSSSLAQEEESAPSSSLAQEEESAPSSSLSQEEESAPSSSLAQEEESAPSSSLAQEEESAPSSSLAQEEESAPSSSLAQEEESAPSSSLAQEEESAPSSSLAQEEESAPSSSLAQEEESAPSSSLAQEEESAPSSSLVQEEESAPSSSLVQEEESAPSSSLAQEEESAPSSSLVQEEESAPSSSLVQEEESAPSSSLVQEEESAPSSSLVQEGGFSAICSVPELRCTSSCSSTKEEEFVSLHGLVQEDTLPSPGMTQAKSMASAGMDQAESVPLSCSAQAESVPSSCSAQAESVPSSCSAQAESVPSSGTAQAESVPSSGTAQAESVPSSGTAQAESVPSSGTAQAESVPSSGTAQAESVPSSGTAQVESVSSSCMVQEGYSLLSNLVMEESTIASGLDVEKGSASTCSLHMSEESTCPPGLVVEEASVHSSSLVKEEQCAISGNLDDLESKVLPNSLQKCKLDRTQLEKRATITRKKTENHCEKLVDMENLDSNEVLTQNRENTNAIESSKCLLKEIVTIEKCPSEHEQKICKQKVADKRQHINAATNKLENSTSTEKSSESSNLNCRGSGAAGTSTLRESSKSATKTGVSDRCPNIEEHLQNNSVDSTSSAPILEQENLGSGSSSLEPRNHIELEQHIFFNHPAYPFNNPEASYKFYEFEIPQALVGRLIGRKGAFVNRIKAITNCNVIVYPHKNKGLKICSIEGTKYSVMRAKDMIREYFPLERYSEVTLEEVHQLRPTLSRLQEDLVLKDLHVRLHLDLPAGVWVDIRVATVVSAGELWVQQPLHPSFAHMERLQVCMNNNYGDGSNTPPLPSPLADGTVCVVQITGQWMRCQVLSTAENVSQILLLDIGDTTFVETSLLRQIRLDYLMLPFQATQCFLSGVQPVRGDVWDDTATTAMKELVSNDYLSAEVVAWTAEDVPLVNLNRRERNQFVQLNERLVQLGHARGAPRQPLG